MRIRGRKITILGLLKFIDDVGGEFFPLDRKGAYQMKYGPKYIWLDDYFPSEVKRGMDRLVRKGWVEKQDTAQGVKVILTERGSREILMFNLEELQPKREKWDRKWRMVFFDVAEVDRKKRDALRRYLRKLGFYKMQESVFINPYDCAAEVKYIREILDIPHGVKLGVLDKIENEDDLKEVFNL